MDQRIRVKPCYYHIRSFGCCQITFHPNSRWWSEEVENKVHRLSNGRVTFYISDYDYFKDFEPMGKEKV